MVKLRILFWQDKIYDEASLVTEHKIKVSCLLLGGRLERPKKVNAYV